MSTQSLGRWFWKETIQGFPLFIAVSMSYAVMLFMASLSISKDPWANENFRFYVELLLVAAPAVMFVAITTNSLTNERSRGVWQWYSLMPTRWWESLAARIVVSTAYSALFCLASFLIVFFVNGLISNLIPLPERNEAVQKLIQDRWQSVMFVESIVFLMIAIPYFCFGTWTRDSVRAILLTIPISVGFFAWPVMNFEPTVCYFVGGFLFVFSVIGYWIEWGRSPVGWRLGHGSVPKSGHSQAIVSDPSFAKWARPSAVECLVWEQIMTMAPLTLIAIGLAWIDFYFELPTRHSILSEIVPFALAAIWGTLSFPHDTKGAMQFESDRGIGQCAAWVVRSITACIPCVVAVIYSYRYSLGEPISPALLAMLFSWAGVLSQQAIGRVGISLLAGFFIAFTWATCLGIYGPERFEINYAIAGALCIGPFLIACSWLLWRSCYRFAKDGLRWKGGVIIILSILWVSYVPAQLYFRFLSPNNQSVVTAKAK